MDKQQDWAAEAHLIACMQQGQSWQQAPEQAGLQHNHFFHLDLGVACRSLVLVSRHMQAARLSCMALK
jgi:hypothetical protein